MNIRKILQITNDHSWTINGFKYSNANIIAKRVATIRLIMSSDKGLEVSKLLKPLSTIGFFLCPKVSGG